MTVTVPLCVRRGRENSIRSVKVKSRSELALERAIPCGIDERSFSMQIRHGSGDKTLSHYAGVHDTPKQNRAAPRIDTHQLIIHAI
jgi:hypothetical protein